MVLRSGSWWLVVAELILHWWCRISWWNSIVRPWCRLVSIWCWRIVLEWIRLISRLRILVGNTWHWCSVHGGMHSHCMLVRAFLAEQMSLRVFMFLSRGSHLLIATVLLAMFRLFFLLWILWLRRLLFWWVNTATSTSWCEACKLPWCAVDEEDLLRWVVGNVK